MSFPTSPLCRLSLRCELTLLDLLEHLLAMGLRLADNLLLLLIGFAANGSCRNISANAQLTLDCRRSPVGPC